MDKQAPNLTKHNQAALESGERVLKWRKIEIIDAIAAVSCLAIAWLTSSWMIAIAGLVICAGIGAYATSQKNKAHQDFLDHVNRGQGMSESLVGATRGRREAENALAGAISQLDEASSKLRRASTYDEKNRAEAAVVSAQAGIESAKLRLQQATVRESSEGQRSQQQTQPTVAQSIQEPLDIGFSGEKVLTNDGYKIYLVKQYKIEKNDVLGKFICDERLFDSIDEALVFASSLESPAGETSLKPVPIEIPEVPEIPEVIVAIQEIHSVQNKNLASTSSDPGISKIKLLIGILLLAVVAFTFFEYSSSTNSITDIRSLDATELKSIRTRLDNYGRGLDKINDARVAWGDQNTKMLQSQVPHLDNMTDKHKNDRRLATREQKIEILNLISYGKKEQTLLEENFQINQPLLADTVEFHRLSMQLNEKRFTYQQELADGKIDFGTYNIRRISIFNELKKQLEVINAKYPHLN